ncbi:TlpA family protein disulfide reductase [Tamaricihabitans halophyticus]|uniref:TlpA family protein disulfide reductase n=1 Tax=Tamaricihabitans halophyticus TaxID=1262583 RepID=UPI00104DA485|nr:TlpA disulfide reductase family protein [Tamaricihabitans halophyticus]
MTVPARWALVAAVLLLATVVALWPRDQGSGGDEAAEPGLDAARVAADLQACPTGSGTEIAQLRGARAECLGNGETTDLGSALAGKTTVVNVWATWCQPCREELPVLQRYAEESGAAQVVGLQVESDRQGGLELVEELGVRFPSFHDTDGSVKRALRVPTGLPASYLLTPDGEVHFVREPRVFTEVEQVREAVRRYADEPATAPQRQEGR